MPGGGYARIELDALPPAPWGRCPQVRPAWKYLGAADSSVAGLFDALAVVRQANQEVTGRDARGRLSMDQQNLLRVALVLTSSGLDACCKRLLRDALPDLIERNGTAAAKFDGFIEEQLRRTEPLRDFLAAVRDRDPRRRMVDLYVASLIKASFQGSSDVKDRVRDALGIANRVVRRQRIERLDEFFTARNAIVHDLDYQEPSSTRTARYSRRMEDVRDQCNDVLALVAELIHAAASNLRAPASSIAVGQ